MKTNKELKASAIAHFESNPEATEFNVTTDGQCFVSENDAYNHGRSLGLTDKDRAVVVFKRTGTADDVDAEQVGSVDTGDRDVIEDERVLTTKTKSPELAESLIKKINEAVTEEAVNAILGNDKRATVIGAAAQRIAALKAGGNDQA